MDVDDFKIIIEETDNLSLADIRKKYQEIKHIVGKDFNHPRYIEMELYRSQYNERSELENNGEVFKLKSPRQKLLENKLFRNDQLIDWAKVAKPELVPHLEAKKKQLKKEVLEISQPSVKQDKDSNKTEVLTINTDIKNTKEAIAYCVNKHRGSKLKKMAFSQRGLAREAVGKFFPGLVGSKRLNKISSIRNSYLIKIKPNKKKGKK